MLKVLSAGEKRFGLGSVLIREAIIPMSTNKEACLGKKGLMKKGFPRLGLSQCRGGHVFICTTILVYWCNLY